MRTDRQENSAFSLLEAVVAVFLLSFAALSVLSLTQSGFVAQKRNQEIARGNLVIQSVVADLRIWAGDINNYKSAWLPYNRTYSPPGYPDYKATVRSRADGREIDSPCAELESQWGTYPAGRRTMPKAVIPVEIVVSWSEDARDSVRVLTYVGEPKRDLASITFQVTGPSRSSIAQGQKAAYDVTARDKAGSLDNLLFQWVPDIRYVSATPDAHRDGRHFELVRDQIPQLPDVPAPKPPALSPITCYSLYAGAYFDANAPGYMLP